MHSDYYDGIARGYNDLHGEEQLQKYRIIAAELNLPLRAQILDVGAGTGLGNQVFPNMVGIDPAAKLLAQHPNPASSVGAAESLPYPDKSFDAVLCVSAFHHTNAEQALSEMQRVSRGIIVITLLKKSLQYNHLLRLLKKRLKPLRCLDESKDTICIHELSREKII